MTGVDPKPAVSTLRRKVIANKSRSLSWLISRFQFVSRVMVPLHRCSLLMGLHGSPFLLLVRALGYDARWRAEHGTTKESEGIRRKGLFLQYQVFNAALCIVCERFGAQLGGKENRRDVVLCLLPPLRPNVAFIACYRRRYESVGVMKPVLSGGGTYSTGYDDARVGAIRLIAYLTHWVCRRIAQDVALALVVAFCEMEREDTEHVQLEPTCGGCAPRIAPAVYFGLAHR